MHGCLPLDIERQAMNRQTRGLSIIQIPRIDRSAQSTVMWQKKPPFACLQSLDESVDPKRLKAIADSVAKQGFWEDTVEWRISTETTSRIERSVRHGSPTFLVTVSCSYIFQCHCPTLERAVYFEQVYFKLIGGMFHTLGWPSWASRTDPQPSPTDTIAT